jgi:glycosyltransferase involved in cell wall biosynthesis
MTIIQITPGAGAMYCGNCLRDNALVASLRKLGHDVLMVPLYLPLTLDETDQSEGTPIFFSGVSVYLGQKSALFRHAPDWLHRLFASPALLKWASGKAAKTRAEDVADLTLSMLRGEEGNQARELSELITWLKQRERPDVICLSNALLLGLARRLKSELQTNAVCMLQGEDYFLDSMPEPQRGTAWEILAERAADADLFIAPSHYFADLMSRRLRLSTGRVRVVYNGINLDGYRDECRVTSDEKTRAILATSSVTRHPSPTLGYFARMCKEKGLDTLVEAYIALRRRDRIKDLKLRIGGSCGPADESFVNEMRERLKKADVAEAVEFHPNPDREGKIKFLKSLNVFSVPALYGEAFGLYVIEALAAGVAVAQPRAAAFPELIEMTGGGVLCEPGKPEALADALEGLLLNPERLRTLGAAGQKTVFEKFSGEAMAREMFHAFGEISNPQNQIVNRKSQI